MGEMDKKLTLNDFLTKVLATPANKWAFKVWDPQDQKLVPILYQDLFRGIQKMTSFYKKRDLVQPKVMVIGSKGFFSSIAILSAWMENGSYCPATLQTPFRKLSQLIQEFNPDVLFIEKMTEPLADFLKNYFKDKTIVLFDEINGSPPPRDLLCLYYSNLPLIQNYCLKPQTRSADSLAYLISTSGTSGSPKLIPITDRQLSSYYTHIMSLLPQSPMVSLIQNFEITFDPSVGDLLWCFSHEASLIPLDLKAFRDINLILKNESRLWWSSTPSLARWATTFFKRENLKPNTLAHSFFLGEILSSSFCREWLEYFPSSKIHNLYGPTETTISISYFTYSPQPDDVGPVPVGEIHKDHTYAIGPDGILSIAGPQVISKYWNDLVENKNFSLDASGNLLYKTGDIGSIQNGNLVIKGRLDTQVKIHGQRFELEEMETFLHLKGLEIVLFPVKNSQNEVEFLAAAVKDKSLTLENLHHILKDDFAPVFFPQSILFVPQFPLTESSKIDRHQLQKFFRDENSKSLID
jgi:D-alanine--poly(phosphoribitol) ligase subunit 1